MATIGEITGGFSSGIFKTDTNGEFNIPKDSEFDDLMKGEFTDVSSSSLEPVPYEQAPLEYDNNTELANNATLMKAVLGNQG
ncbi:hypothetical protein [Arcobacter sp. F2176]|uniref:hypothetical protein n=1 Tax=Arcobacter sp. F2176 TaxID=2044511 RepID=UPI00100BA74D|nr:hypothetical protein [Arcobacter sp. F2176]RXJ81548.1 hypothetical protein CRU95_06470 [Arcobacter sp. F2176]